MKTLNLSACLSALLCILVVPAGGEPAGPAAEGLRLSLAVAMESDGRHSFSMSLHNLSESPRTIVADWPYEDQAGSVADFLLCDVVLETTPAVLPPYAQSGGIQRQSAQPGVTLETGGKISVGWTGDGNWLKPPSVFGAYNTSPCLKANGLYWVRAALLVRLRGENSVLLYSNPVPVSIGRSDHMPKHATAEVVDVSPDANTATLSLGRLHGVELNDIFFISSGLSASWRMTVTRVEELTSSGRFVQEYPDDPSGPDTRPTPGLTARLVSSDP